MPTTKERLELIEERLEILDAALGIKPVEPPSALRQAWGAFKSWLTLHKNGVRWTIGIAVTLAGWFFTANYKIYLDHKNDALNAAVDSRVNGTLSKPGGVAETLEKLSKTVDRIDATQNTLRPFINDVVVHQFENTSKLSVPALSDRLSAVNDLLAVAEDQHLSLDRRAAETVGKNLAHVNKETQAYWPAAGRLISASFSDSQPNVSKEVDCFTETIPPQPGSLDLMVYRNLVWTDCTLRLDDLQGFARSYAFVELQDNLMSRGKPFEVSLLRVKIIYSGGQPIPFTKLTATNCAFEFNLPSTPTAKGQVLVEALLPDFTRGNLTIRFPPDPKTPA